MNKKELREAIISYRRWSNLTYSEIGRILNVHKSTIQKIISGKLNPSKGLQKRIQAIIRKKEE